MIKKLEIPVPKPYPVHVIYYKHISEDDPPPPKQKYTSLGVPGNKYSSLQMQFSGEFPASANEDHDHPFSGF